IIPDAALSPNSPTHGRLPRGRGAQPEDPGGAGAKSGSSRLILGSNPRTRIAPVGVGRAGVTLARSQTAAPPPHSAERMSARRDDGWGATGTGACDPPPVSTRGR